MDLRGPQRQNEGRTGKRYGRGKASRTSLTAIREKKGFNGVEWGWEDRGQSKCELRLPWGLYTKSPEGKRRTRVRVQSGNWNHKDLFSSGKLRTKETSVSD